MTQKPLHAKNHPTGLVYLFTGEGKGKTSAALGTMLRSLAHGWQVSWVAFYKEASWGVSEVDFPELLCQTPRPSLRCCY